MNTKTTSKGTILPLLNLKGKPYLQVAHRLVWFREDHPSGRITTSLIQLGDNYAVAKAEIYVVGQKPSGEPFEALLSSAHKKETEANFGDFIEKAETGAIGRALAMAGYGTQFEPELDEGDRLADSPIQPAKRQEVKPAAPVPAEIPKSFNRKTVLTKITEMSKVIIDSKRDTQENVVKLLEPYEAKDKNELTDEQLKQLCLKLEEKLK